MTAPFPAEPRIGPPMQTPLDYLELDVRLASIDVAKSIKGSPAEELLLFAQGRYTRESIIPKVSERVLLFLTLFSFELDTPSYCEFGEFRKQIEALI